MRGRSSPRGTTVAGVRRRALVLPSCVAAAALSAGCGSFGPPAPVEAPPTPRLTTADIPVRAAEARQALQAVLSHPGFAAWTLGAGRAPIAAGETLSEWTMRRSLALSLQGVPRLDAQTQQSLLRTLKVGWRRHRGWVCAPLIAGEPLTATEIGPVRTVWWYYLGEQDYQGLLRGLREGATAMLDRRAPAFTTDALQLARAQARVDTDMRRWHGEGWRERLRRVPAAAVTVTQCEAMADLMLAAENLDEDLRAALLRSWFDPEGGGWPAAWPNPAAPLEAL